MSVVRVPSTKTLPPTRALAPPRKRNALARRARSASLAPFALALAFAGALDAHAAESEELVIARPSVRSETLTHEWRSVEGKHWTIVDGSTPEDPAATDIAEGNTGRCASGMVAISGSMKQDHAATVEALQETVCTEWIHGSSGLRRCARFDRDAWREVSSSLATTPMRYCIDRFEFPNLRRAYPIIFVTWSEAQSLCKRENKRLCTESEWTFACEGEEALPYPYGYDRDESACVIDRPNPAYDAKIIGTAPRNSLALATELDRLWRGESAGSRPRCRSPFGVYDLTGNVDEWTSSVHPGERPSILKGGYWGRIRARCRPSTRAHAQDFAFYQQGFRCCSDMVP